MDIEYLAEQGKPVTSATDKTHALTLFLWTTSAPQHEI